VEKKMENSDTELIQETLAGNLQAYDALMKRYQDRVYTIALSFGKTKENALDISQDIFLKVYKKLNTFKENSTFKTWVSKVAFNESVNWTRKNKKYIQNDEIDSDGPKLYDYQNPEDQLLVNENKTLLLRCLFDLNTKYRLAVVLRYFENMPIKEIAISMDCSEGMVKNMLFRSIQKLRNSLPALQDGVRS
jgi:RNA polymerase sigma-70 factor (ECF subfamily)